MLEKVQPKPVVKCKMSDLLAIIKFCYCEKIKKTNLYNPSSSLISSGNQNPHFFVLVDCFADNCKRCALPDTNKCCQVLNYSYFCHISGFSVALKCSTLGRQRLSKKIFKNNCWSPEKHSAPSSNIDRGYWEQGSANVILQMTIFLNAQKTIKKNKKTHSINPRSSV